MPAYRKASIRDLTRAAYELDGRFTEGRLHRDAEDGRWMLNDQPLEQWLMQFENQDVTFIVVGMEDARPIEERICRTCGRKYIDVECPYCREARVRLRGA